MLLSITLIFGALHKTRFGTNLVETVKTVSQRLFSFGVLSYQSFPPLLCQSDPPSLFLSFLAHFLLNNGDNRRPLRVDEGEFKYQKPTMDTTPDSKELLFLAPTIHLLITGEMREEG